MDPNAVVLEISSDEDVGWNEHNRRGTADGGDDHNWLAEILDEVNKGSLGDDSDDVVVVSGVSPSAKTGKKSKLKSSLLDLDDDCVILDKDPEKPVEVLNDKPSNIEDDSDDIVVVSEKGQVACRDYPHPRHLCIKFPFSTTPNQTHCDQCYCYVCDSLAPCVYWGNGSSTTDHCHATDKDEIWKHHRKNAKSGTKPVPPLATIADMAQFNGLPPLPTAQPNVRPGPIRSHHQLHNFRAQNILSQIQRPVFPSRGKVHRDLFHQYMVGKSKNTSGLAGFSNNVVNTLKRNGSVGSVGSVGVVATAPNRHHPYTPHRGSSVNSNRQQSYNQTYLQPNPVNNTSVSYPHRSQQHQAVNPNPVVNQQHINSSSSFSNYQNPNIQSQPQISNYPNPNPFYQTRPVPPSSQPGQASYPVHANPLSYLAPSQTTPVDTSTPSISVSDYTNLPNQGTQAKGNGLSWPTNEGTGPVNESSSMPGGLGDFPYDWIFDNQPVEPGFVDGLGSYGPTDFSSDSSFIDAGPIFDF